MAMEKRMDKDIEHRKDKRAVIVGSYVQYKVLDASRWSLYQDELREPIKNISRSGVCFETGEALLPNMLVGLNIKFNEAAPPIKLFGRVVWSRDKKDEGLRYENGIVFSLWIKEKDRRELDRFIEGQLAEGTIYKWS